MGKSPSRVVAVLEDDPDDRIILVDAFAECRPDVRVELFEKGPELLDRLHRRGKFAGSGGPHLVVLGFHVPEEADFELIVRIKDESDLRRIPLLVLCDALPAAEVERCYSLGANTVIVRPDKFGEYLRILKSVCDYWFAVVSG